MPETTTDARRRRVLVVDDHEDTRVLMEAILDMAGYHVVAAEDGVEALVQLANGRFDVAIFDIGLPVLDGYAAARTARERFGMYTPYLVALTGFGRQQDREAARAAGFDVHLVKPITPEALTEAVHHGAALRATQLSGSLTPPSDLPPDRE